jgi:hypothetical protein
MAKAPWDQPCDAKDCDRDASSSLVGHPEVPNGAYCNAHLPKDDRGYTRCLND